MLTKLRVKQFKNFKQAELVLGPLTLLVGANASGKSNIRDAFRFLHGIARGYALADIVGEKYGEEWRGIRGGLQELGFQGASTFILEISFPIVDLFLLIVDRDGEEHRRTRLNDIEHQAAAILSADRRFFTEHAWQEVEV